MNANSAEAAANPENERYGATKEYIEELGNLYKLWTLDCVARAAFAVAKDFSRRLDQYKDVDDGVVQKLTDLQARYGFHPDFPDDAIRNSLMRPIFGPSDGYTVRDEIPPEEGPARFDEIRRHVIETSRDFAENAQPIRFPSLRERFRSGLIPFRNFLADRQGRSFSETARRILASFDRAQTILRDENVRVVFGINRDINPNWPLASTDPNGAKLIEKITMKFPDMFHETVHLDRFVRLQRIAEKGQQSITGAFDVNLEIEDDAADPVISQFYAWGSDLGMFARDSYRGMDA